MEKKKTEGKWLVLSRHFAMSGGIFDYGEGQIEEFFDCFDDAVKFAEKKIVELITFGHVDPYVWVLRCERTYVGLEGGKPAFVHTNYPNDLFVDHIKNHLNRMPVSPSPKVMCKICNKTIDEIIEADSNGKEN